MLLQFSVENYLSFKEQAVLSLVPSSDKEHLNNINDNGTFKGLNTIAIYGANASGKTNLVEFFRFFKDCVRGGIPMEATQMFCKNKEENKERESNFELQLTVDDKFYAYGFSAILSERWMTGEWLYEL